MKKLIFSILAICTTAFATESAKEVTIHFSSFRTYYSCDYAENQTAKYLKGMGAEVLSVRCYGGIDHNNIDSSLRIKAKYQLPTVANQENWVSLNIQGREACDLNTTILDKLISQFSVRNSSVTKRCIDSQGRFSYNLQILAL